MNVQERAGSAIAAAGNGQLTAAALVITPDSVLLRRQLGPLAWMALQHLALNCHRTEGGWAAGLGVRDIDAAGVEAFVEPLPVGAVEVLGRQPVQSDVFQPGADALDLESVASNGGR